MGPYWLDKERNKECGLERKSEIVVDGDEVDSEVKKEE
jgi:hypothetical protein